VSRRSTDAIAVVVSGALHGAVLCAGLAVMASERVPSLPPLAVDLVDAPTETREAAPRLAMPRPEPVRPAPPRPPKPLSTPTPAQPPEPLIVAREIPDPATAPPPVAPATPAPEVTAAPPPAVSATSHEATSRETPAVGVRDAASAGATPVAGSSGPPRPVEGPAASGPAVAAVPPSATVAGPVTRAARPRGGYQVRPPYPTEARLAKAEGTTLLRVHVAADGSIDDVQVERSAGHSALDRAAAEAVRQWRFEPARSGSVAVAVWVLIPVQFRLEGDF
jgi:periplasmic protein TonB